jgi:hypothetical protein
MSQNTYTTSRDLTDALLVVDEQASQLKLTARPLRDDEQSLA